MNVEMLIVGFLKTVSSIINQYLKMRISCCSLFHILHGIGVCNYSRRKFHSGGIVFNKSNSVIHISFPTNKILRASYLLEKICR